MAAEDIGSIYPTKIPGYEDAADIQAALKLYHYGTSADVLTENAIVPNSVVGYIKALDTRVDDVEALGTGSTYISSEPVTPINGYIWVDADETGNGGPTYTTATYSATEPPSPVDGVIWVDKGSTPPLAKIYNAGTSTWDLINPLPALVDSAGDLVYASADNTLAKLSIGSNGQILKVDAGLPSWETEKTWVLKGSGSMSGTSAVSVSGLSGERLYVTLKDWSHDNTLATVMLNLRFNNDAGPNYVNTGGLISASSLHSPLFNDTGTHDLAFSVDLANTAADLKPVATIADSSVEQYFGYYKNTSAITSLQISLSSSGNFDSGSYQVWSYE